MRLLAPVVVVVAAQLGAYCASCQPGRADERRAPAAGTHGIPSPLPTIDRPAPSTSWHPMPIVVWSGGAARVLGDEASSIDVALPKRQAALRAAPAITVPGATDDDVAVAVLATTPTRDVLAIVKEVTRVLPRARVGLVVALKPMTETPMNMGPTDFLPLRDPAFAPSPLHLRFAVEKDGSARISASGATLDPLPATELEKRVIEIKKTFLAESNCRLKVAGDATAEQLASLVAHLARDAQGHVLFAADVEIE